VDVNPDAHDRSVFLFRVFPNCFHNERTAEIDTWQSSSEYFS
jgi:hypothetical protein